LAGEWIRIREVRGLSQREIGRICGLSNVTPWKVENGKSLRWETLHLMMKEGMKILPGSPDYELIHRLWLLDREHIAENQPKDHAKRNPEKHVLNAVGRFRRIVKDMDPATLERFMGRVSRVKRV
jgi:transcriptional regulator with XRE-family HTH domain